MVSATSGSELTQQQAESSYRTANGTPVWVSGAGPTVILVHGVLMDHRMWAPQVAAFANDYRVCCIDMLGHGSAPNPPGVRTLDDFVAQLHEVVTHFSDNGAPVVGGFSMGGLITQAYAIRYHADLRGAMIMNAVYDRSAEQSAIVRQRSQEMCDVGVAAALESANSRWFVAADKQHRAPQIEMILDWMRDGEFAAKVKAHQVFATSDTENTGKLQQIRCPTLVMTGDGDAGSTPAMAEQMAAELPDSELHVLDAQRHMMTVLDAARVNSIIGEFLRRAFAAS